MAVTLKEAAKLSNDELAQGVIETFIQESRIMDRVPFKEIAGNSYRYNQEDTLPGVEFRAVNSAYAESTGTVNPESEHIVILGGDADVDTFIAKTTGSVADQRAEQDRMKVKAMAFRFADSFINGDVQVDANAFDGLKKRLTGGQVIDAGANGIPIVGASSNDRHAFFDKLDELLAAVKGGAPDALYMNSVILGAIRSSARREGFWATERDEFGRLVERYNDVEMIDIGENATGEDIIPMNEKMGNKEGTSSIYAVRFGSDLGDRAVTGLQNGGLDVRDLGELQAKPAFRTRIEWFLGLAVFGPGAARLRGLYKV